MLNEFVRRNYFRRDSGANDMFVSELIASFGLETDSPWPEVV